MTPERWQRVRGVFDDAAELAPEARAAFVGQACGEDAELRVEVEALLGAASAGSDLGRAIEREAERMLAGVGPNRRLGPYQLVEELGAGGMGTVYLAERVDEQYRTQVAVKVLPLGLKSPHAVARFRDERQILATLEHPSIVRLLDGGSTEEGLPYLVMERIEGSPITRHAREHKLSVRARIELFLEVCSAVQYAHQMLVVHRDIKPSNILVGQDGVPKLLDFGIARLLDEGADGALREAHTGTGMALFTPEYASPEQVRAQPVHAASDIYSLGAVLYELLADAPAHRFSRDALDILRVVCDVDPGPPSAAAPPERRRALAGDLDNIVLKAMQKEPGRRYASVHELADDLGRHLAGLPVSARANTWRYRTGKLIRRNRTALTIALAVVAALTTATIVSVGQATRADEEARLAGRRAAETRRLAESLLFEVDGAIRDLQGATHARELVARRALEYLDGLVAEGGDDVSLAREVAIAYMKVGDIQGSTAQPSLGRSQDGLASYHKAKAILDGLAATGHDDAATQQAQARALFGIGQMAWSLGDIKVGRPALVQAIALAEALPPGYELEPEVLARGDSSLSNFDFAEGDAAMMARDFEHALARAERWDREAHSAEARYWLGIAYENRVRARLIAADPEAAMRDNDESGAILDALAAEHPENEPYAREQFIARVNAAAMHSGMADALLWYPTTGDPGVAETLLAPAVAIAERLAARDPDNTVGRLELATIVATQAATIALRSPADAVPHFERSLALFRALPDAVRAAGYARQLEWYTQCAAAEPFARVGRPAEARAAADAGLAMTASDASAPGATRAARLRYAMCRFLVAGMHDALGDRKRTESELGGVADSLEGFSRERPSDIAIAIGLVASLERLAALDRGHACGLYTRAVAAWRRWQGTPTSFTTRRLGELERALGACAAP